jgi:hypothetical protein
MRCETRNCGYAAAIRWYFIGQLVGFTSERDELRTIGLSRDAIADAKSGRKGNLRGH